ncbi:spherulation-specific family 4 protein [Metarhizium robertsii]|uniref:Spherulin 4-like cell surface n=2 Tax=Metarhizium robertsii TaxID=568076 RepID=E9FC29_METRA|nr:spherulin 4-like cell surface [Metarhizium robertsii ARSEF 23]EFY94704.1 spherulin 4-like cell surface [Metarhizium robertsii ARSEF 23]EXU96330.1 spherulation-specific family 4 protein [Metarhizium robertsii]
MNLQHHLPRPWRRSKWFWPGVALVAVAVIIAIVVPLAVLLPRRNRKQQPPTNVILPLYIYPLADSSWSPVYDAVSRRPDLNFTVIVNPSSGPGSSPYPDVHYDAAIRRLNSYPNIETVGYVRTGYATRNLSDVTAEVAVYSGWFSNASALAMHGIFFDEAPHEYSPEAVEFLRAADSFVKSAPGLQGRKTIIHNPGVIPDARFNGSDVDVTVVFEETYDKWQDRSRSLAALPKTRGAYSVMVNTVPTMSNGTLSQFVNSLSDLAKYVFITSLSVDFYNSFANDWLDFVGQVPA